MKTILLVALGLFLFSLTPRGYGSEMAVCNETNLRQAIQSGGLIAFSCDGVIVLAAPLRITNSVTLDGTGRAVTLSGGQLVRLFEIEATGSLLLRNLVLADGWAQGTNGGLGIDGGPGKGGAVYNQGGLFVADGCTFVGNQARGGAGGDRAPDDFLNRAGGGGVAHGGVIYNDSLGQVKATNCQFVSNAALGGSAGLIGTGAGGSSFGGVIYSTNGQVHLTHCLVTNNSAIPGAGRRMSTLGGNAAGFAGAISIDNSQLVLHRVVVAYNTVSVDALGQAHGGALYQAGGSCQISASHFHHNSTYGGRGLGIATIFGVPGGAAFGGALTIAAGELRAASTTFDHNIALGGPEPGSGANAGGGHGGAIFNGGHLQLLNCSIADNEASAGRARMLLLGNIAKGGGLCNVGATSLLAHVTFVGNSARPFEAHLATNLLGGAIFNEMGSVTLSNSILAYSPYGSNSFGTLTDGGHNISSDHSAGFTAPGSLNDTDPVVSSLGDFGGPTPTLALLEGSPAIDTAGNEACPSTDQRGIARPFGAACDIGAFESSPPYTISGFVFGYLPSSPRIVVSSEQVDARGYYSYRSPPGNHTVTPGAPDTVIVPAIRNVTIGPDRVNINFVSYRSNAFVLERVGLNDTRGTFAGAAGEQ